MLTARRCRLNPTTQPVSIELGIEEVDACCCRSAVPERREVVRAVLLQIVTIEVRLLDHECLRACGPALQIRLEVFELNGSPRRVYSAASRVHDLMQVAGVPAFNRQTTRFHPLNLPIRQWKSYLARTFKSSAVRISMLAVRAVKASPSRCDSCSIRDKSAAESAGGSETVDTTLILFVLSCRDTLGVYHPQDPWSIPLTTRVGNAAIVIAFCHRDSSRT